MRRIILFLAAIFSALSFTLGFAWAVFLGEDFIEMPNVYNDVTISRDSYSAPPSKIFSYKGQTYFAYHYGGLLVIGKLDGPKTYIAFPATNFAIYPTESEIEIVGTNEPYNELKSVRYVTWSPDTNMANYRLLNGLFFEGGTLRAIKSGDHIYVFYKPAGSSGLSVYRYDLENNNLDYSKRLPLKEGIGYFSVATWQGAPYLAIQTGYNLYFGRLEDGDGSLCFEPELVATGTHYNPMLMFDENGNPAIFTREGNFFIKNGRTWTEEEVQDAGSLQDAYLNWMNGWYLTYKRSGDNDHIYLQKRLEDGWQIVGSLGFPNEVEFSASSEGDSIYVHTTFGDPDVTGQRLIKIYEYSGSGFSEVQDLDLFGQRRAGRLYIGQGIDGLPHILLLKKKYASSAILDSNSYLYEIHPIKGSLLSIERVGTIGDGYACGFDCYNVKLLYDDSGEYATVTKVCPYDSADPSSNTDTANIWVFEKGANGWDQIASRSMPKQDFGQLNTVEDLSISSLFDGNIHIFIHSPILSKEPTYNPQGNPLCPPYAKLYNGKCWYQALMDYTCNLSSPGISDAMEVIKHKPNGATWTATNDYLFWYQNYSGRLKIFKHTDYDNPDYEFDFTPNGSRIAAYSNGDDAIVAARSDQGLVVAVKRDGAWNLTGPGLICDDGQFLCGEDNCTDNIDNDYDGLIDEKEFSGSCQDGLDNDADGYTDETRSVNYIPRDAYFFQGMPVVSAGSILLLSGGNEFWSKLPYPETVYFTGDDTWLSGSFDNYSLVSVKFLKISTFNGPRIAPLGFDYDFGTLQVGGTSTISPKLRGYCVVPFRFIDSFATNYGCSYPGEPVFPEASEPFSLRGPFSSSHESHVLLTFNPQTEGNWIYSGTLQTNDPLHDKLSFNFTGGAKDLSVKGALDNPRLSWFSSEVGYWKGQLSCGAFDGDAARSNQIGDLQSSGLWTRVIGPETLTFSWKVSSQEGHDFLRFYIDDELQDEISGEVDWQTKSYEIPQGQHTLKWVYAKDESGREGADAGWLDNVIWDGSTPEITVYHFDVSPEPTNGTVTSEGIACGTGGDDCSESFDEGSQVTLDALPDDGFQFAGWTGDCENCGANSTCIITMDSEKTCSAEFEPMLEPPVITNFSAEPTEGMAPLTVNFTCSAYDPDGGDIESIEWYFDSGQWPDYVTFDDNFTTTYTYTEPGVYTAHCRVWDDDEQSTESDNITITVTAPPINYELDVSVNPEVGGSVTGEGIGCPGDCSETYEEGTSVTLTAEPAEGYMFTGWTDDCEGCEGSECTILMDSNKTCEAEFQEIPNEPPVIDSFTADPTSGDTPLTVTFTCNAHDPDGAISEYCFDFDGDGAFDQCDDSTNTATYTYDTPGTYHPTCKVVDDDEAETVSEPLTITVNEAAPAWVDITDALNITHSPRQLYDRIHRAFFILVTIENPGDAISGPVRMIITDPSIPVKTGVGVGLEPDGYTEDGDPYFIIVPEEESLEAGEVLQRLRINFQLQRKRLTYGIRIEQLQEEVPQ